MVRTGEGNREDMREEDATLSRRDKQQARSFAVGGHWSRRVHPMSVRHNRTRAPHMAQLYPLTPHHVSGISHTIPAYTHASATLRACVCAVRALGAHSSRLFDPS
jgi:hypothetical protein